ncbi:MAG: tyrosine-type recombinase/integrase [Burkholderiaceae bacterium]
MKTPLQTKAQIAALPVPVIGQALYWDTGDGAIEGFGVRVTANGKKAYVVQARVNGASRRVVVGQCTGRSAIALEQALRKAGGMLEQLKDKQVDLTAEKREGRAAAKAKRVKDATQAWTLREVMEQYLRERTVNDRPLKDSTKRDIRRHVEKNFGDWADAPVAAITVEAVKVRFAKLQARAPQQAKQGMGILRALLSFARDEASTKAGGNTFPLLALNPVSAGLKRKLKPADGRETMVPLDRVRATWRMLEERRAQSIADSPERTGIDIVSFGLLTGCRLGEAQNLTFDLIDLEEGWWKITAAVAKDRKARTLPLCAAAVALLRARAARPGNPFVFPSRTMAGRQHFKAPRGALDRVSKVAGLHLSFHDLRRTYMSVAAECRIEEWR